MLLLLVARVLLLVLLLGEATATSCPQVKAHVPQQHAQRGKPVSLAVRVRNGGSRPVEGLTVSVAHSAGIQYVGSSTTMRGRAKSLVAPAVVAPGLALWALPPIKWKATLKVQLLVPTCFFPSTLDLNLSAYIYDGVNNTVSCMRTFSFEQVSPSGSRVCVRVRSPYVCRCGERKQVGRHGS